VTIFDQQMFEKEYLMGGSGSNSVTIKYLVEDLKKIPNCKILDVANNILKEDGGRVLAGIRSSGQLHLGNYLGAVKGMIALQNNPRYATNYMVADLHAITTPYNVASFQHDTRSVIIDYLSAGLDPEKSVLFVQSQVREHVELAYLLSTVITVARAQHLPTYKDKFQQQQGNVSMALFQYPVLMAADILLYKADLVPVGIDQEPHIEITREIARKMNVQYGMDFPEPARFATTGEYVPSLTGTGKMSKSISGSYINLTDDLITIKKRLAGAPTDSGKGPLVPVEGGVTNLLKLVELFEGQEKRKAYESMYTGSGIRYGDLKNELAIAIDKELAPIREKRKELESKPEYVDKVIREGAEKARAIASQTVAEVKTKMGLG
jgi:tryptophanyl-tRNA synthetase